MKSYEFKTDVKDNIIRLPKKYQHLPHQNVRV